ncbi:MAG: hypothetical protein Q4P34_04935 [Tissierellia bacterium]|nr:hypothetical protein [Tissierellia bacterium]
MKKYIVVLLIFVLITGCENIVEYDNKNINTESELSEDKNFTFNKLYNINELKDDIKQYNEIINKVAQITDNQIKDIEIGVDEIERSMTEFDFLKILSRNTAQLNNNDFYIIPSLNFEKHLSKNTKLFPSEALVINDLIILEGEYDNLINPKVLSINSIPYNIIIEDMMDIINYNGNIFAAYDRISEEFKYLFYLLYGESEDYIIKIESNGETSIINLTGRIYDDDLIIGEPYEENLIEDCISYKKFQESGKNIAYLKINTIVDNEDNFINKFEMTISDIIKNDTDVLLLDTSDNKTRNPELTKEIFSYFIQEETEYNNYNNGYELCKPNPINYDKDLVLIVSPKSSSIVNQLNLRLLNDNVKIAGVNTSSGNIAYYDLITEELANTKIRITYPRKCMKIIGETELYEYGLKPDYFNSGLLFKNSKDIFIKEVIKKMCST